MIDKADVMVPYSASFRSDFKFVLSELEYAGFLSTVKRSQHYLGTCDLRPFNLDAIVHIHFKRRGHKNHKLEIIDAGEKSVDQMGKIITAVFDIEPTDLRMMRIDFAADLFGVPVIALFNSLRVKFKRSSDVRGELDYETVGTRQLEYFRYGKSPNCIRTYDKPAECKARFRQILKKANPDAEPPTFEEYFGFPENTIMARVERQAGGGRIPVQLGTFGQLYNAAEFNPYQNLEYIPEKFPLPDPRQIGDARSVKLIGLHRLIETFGYQQARAMLNTHGNAKRLLDDYDAYVKEAGAITSLTVDAIIDSYRCSTLSQVDGSIEKRVVKSHIPHEQESVPLKSENGIDRCNGTKHND